MKLALAIFLLSLASCAHKPLPDTVKNYTGGTDAMAAALPYNSPHGSTGGDGAK